MKTNIQCKNRRITVLAMLVLFCLTAFAGAAVISSPHATAFAENGETPAYAAGVTADGTETGYDDFVTAFRAAEALSSKGGKSVTIRLYAATQFTEQLSVSKGADITLDLNGFALRRRNSQVKENTFDLPYDPDSSVDTGKIFEIYGKLTLDDSAPERIHTNADRETIGVPIYTKLPAGGLVTGSYLVSWNSGSLFEVSGGEFVINGGKIYGNSGTGGGDSSLVMLKSNNTLSKLTMNGGEISVNYFRAIVNKDGTGNATFEMNGGRITDNGIYCTDEIEITADGYVVQDSRNIFNTWHLAVRNDVINVVISGNAYLYDNYYVPSRMQAFRDMVSKNDGKPLTNPSLVWDMKEEKALYVGTYGSYAELEDRQAKTAHMQPNMLLEVSVNWQTPEGSFEIGGDFTGKVGLYDYGYLYQTEGRRPQKLIVYKLLPGAEMNGTVDIVDNGYQSSENVLPDEVKTPVSRYEMITEGSDCVLYKKVFLSVTPSGNVYYMEEADNFPSATASATTLDLDGGTVSIEGTLTYDKSYQAGVQKVVYSYTPKDELLYGVRTGSFNTVGQDVRELKVTYNGGSQSSGTKLADISSYFTVDLVYNDGHTVRLDPSKYVLNFGERSSQTQLHGGVNTIYAQYIGGVSGAMYEGSATVTAEGVNFEVYDDREIYDDTPFTVYNTFDEAVNAALTKSRATIVMYQDWDVTNPITVDNGKELTIDLNGHVLNLANLKADFTYVPRGEGVRDPYYKVQQNPFLTVTGYGTSLTVADSAPASTHLDNTLPKGGVLTGMRFNSVVRVSSSGYFALDGGTIYKNATEGTPTKVADKGTQCNIKNINIAGVAIRLDGGSAMIGKNGAVIQNGYIKDWAFGEISNDAEHTVYATGQTTLSIYGRIENNLTNGVAMSGGTLFLHDGGSIKNNSVKDDDDPIYGLSLSGTKFTMSGGIVSGNDVLLSGGQFRMEGGTIASTMIQQYGASTVLIGGSIASYRWLGGSISLGDYGQSAAKQNNVTISRLYMVEKRLDVYGKFTGKIFVETNRRPAQGSGERIRLTNCDNEAAASAANILSYDPWINTVKLDGEVYLMAKLIGFDVQVSVAEFYPGDAFPEITLVSATSDATGATIDVPGKLYWENPSESAPDVGTYYRWVFEPDDPLVFGTMTGNVRIEPIAVTKIEAKLSSDLPKKLYTDTAPEIILPYITVTRTWEGGRVDALDAKDFTVSLPQTFVAGSNTIGINATFGKKTFTTTVSVTVIQVVTTGIDVEFTQSQKLFVETRVADYPAIFGDNLQVWLNYNNGKRDRLHDYVISPQPRYTGSQELSILYGTYSAPLNVYIYGVSLSGISGIFSDSGRERVRTDFTLDQLLPYVTARYIYNNGTYGDAVNFATGNFQIYYPTGVSGLHAGYNTLEISFRSEAGGVVGTKYYGTVQIPAVEAESFTVSLDQTNTTIFTSTKAEDLKTLLGGKLTITANYSDGTTENVTSKVTLSGDFSVSGDVTVTLGQQAVTDTFTVTLTQPLLTGITAFIDESKSYQLWTTDTPDKVKEKLPLIVRAKYSDGTVTELTKDEYTLSSSTVPYTKNFRTNYWDGTPVTITYLDKTTSVTPGFRSVFVKQLSATVDRSQINLFSGDLYKNDLPDAIKGYARRGAIVISVTYDDDETFSTSDHDWTDRILNNLSVKYYDGKQNYIEYGYNKINLALVKSSGTEGFSYSYSTTIDLWGNAITPVSLETIASDQGDIIIYTSHNLADAVRLLNSAYKFKLTYTNGATETYGLSSSSMSYAIVDGSMTTPGTVTLRVKHSKFSDGYQDVTFTVTEVKPAALSVVMPDGTTFPQNSTVDIMKNRITVYLMNNDGSKANSGKPLRADEYTLSGDVSKLGSTTITASYTSAGFTYTAEFNVAITVPVGKLEISVDFSSFTPVVGNKVADAIEHISVYLVLDNGTRTLLGNNAVTFGYAGGTITDETVFVSNADSKITVSYTYNETPLTASFVCGAVTEVPPQGTFSDFALDRQVYTHNSIEFFQKHSSFTYTASDGRVIKVETGVGFTVTFKDPNQTGFVVGANTVLFHMFDETHEHTVTIKEAAVMVADGSPNEPLYFDSLKNAFASVSAENNPYGEVVTVTLLKDQIHVKDGCIISSAFNISHNKLELILDLNGHIIDRAMLEYSAQRGKEVFFVEKGNFTITDSDPDAAHPAYADKNIPAGGVITGGGNAGVHVEYDGTSYTFTLNGGSIWKNKAERYGGGVYLSDYNKFIMNGGVISGNYIESDYYGYGGGVYLGYRSTFTLNDGIIANNRTQRSDKPQNGTSPGVHVGNEATFTMNGGVISNDLQQKGSNNSLVLLQNYTNFYLNGGFITSTTVETCAIKNEYSTIIMSGNPVVKGGIRVNAEEGYSFAINFSGEFGGSFEVNYIAEYLKLYDKNDARFYYQPLGTLLNGAKILPTAQITHGEQADALGNKHFVLNTDTDLGVVFEFRVLESVFSVQVGELYEGFATDYYATTYQGGVPLTLADGGTAGKVTWTSKTSSSSIPNTYIYRFTPTYQYGYILGYTIVEREHTFVPVTATGVSVTAPSDYTVYESTDITSDSFKNRFTFVIKYADGTEKTLRYSDFSTAFNAEKSQIVFTLNSTILNDERGVTSLPVSVVPVAIDNVSAATKSEAQISVRTTLDELKNLIDVTAVNNDGTKYNGGAAIANYTLSFKGGAASLKRGDNVLLIEIDGKTHELLIKGVLYGAIEMKWTNVNGSYAKYFDSIWDVNDEMVNKNRPGLNLIFHADIIKGNEFWSTTGLNIKINYSCTIDLNGYIFDVGGQYYAIQVLLGYAQTGTKITIQDSNPMREHTGYAKEYPAGGVITGASKSGIYFYDNNISGTNKVVFEMTGGTVWKNGGVYTDYYDSGGINFNAANVEFVLGENANVFENIGVNGGGVYAARGTVTLSGKIYDNTATNGGGVYIASGWATLAGKIYNNTATNGGGVYIGVGRVATLSGEIYGNAAENGGGVYGAKGGLVSITLENVKIYNNTASTSAGGYIKVCDSYNPTPTTLKGRVEVYGNSCGGSESNFVLDSYIDSNFGKYDIFYFSKIVASGTVTGKLCITAPTAVFPGYLNTIGFLTVPSDADIGGLTLVSETIGAEMISETSGGTSTYYFIVRGAVPSYEGVHLDGSPSTYYDTYGPLPALYSINDAIPGTVSWDEGQTIVPGMHYYAWTFIPSDANFVPVHGTFRLNYYFTNELAGANVDWSKLSGDASLTLDELKTKISDSSGRILRLGHSPYFQNYVASKNFHLEFANGRTGWETSGDRNVVNYFDIVYESDGGYVFRQTVSITIAKLTLTDLTVTLDLASATISERDNIARIRDYLTVSAQYEGSETPVTVTDYAVYGTLNAGTSVVEVYYGGLMQTVEFEVQAVQEEEVTGITLDYSPGNARLTTKDTIADLRSYLTVMLTYTDGATKQITDYTVDNITFAAGDNVITVRYKDYSETFTAYLLQGIEIVWVTDDFTYDGTDQSAKITAYYLDANGTRVDLAVSGGAFKDSGSVVFTAAFITEVPGYVLPSEHTKTYTMKKATLTVTAVNHSIVYGAAPANNGAGYSGFVEGEGESVLSGALVYTCNYEQYGDCGTYAIILGGLSAQNYEITYVNGVLTVSPAAVTVTIDNVRIKQGAEQQALTAEVTAGTVFNNDTLQYTLSVACENFNIPGKYTVTGTDNDKNYVITFDDGEYEIYSIADYLEIKAKYGDLIMKNPDTLTWKEVKDASYMCSAYAMLDKDNSDEFSEAEKNAILALKSKVTAVYNALNDANRELAALDGITAIGLRGGEFNKETVAQAIETANAAVKTFTDLSSGLEEADLEKYENVAAAEQAVADYISYLSFQTSYGETYAKEPTELTYGETASVTGMYAAYLALTDDVKGVLTEEEVANVSALKAKAVALVTKKELTDGALDALTTAIWDGTDKETLQDLLAAAQNKLDGFLAENGTAQDLSAYGAIEDSKEKISEYEKQEFEQQVTEDLGAIEDYTPEAIGGMDIPNLEDTIGKVQDAIDKIDASSDKTKEELADKREELVEVKDALNEKLHTEYEKQEFEQQVTEDLGAIEDYTPEAIGGMDIPNLEDTIGKVQNAIDKIDASSDLTKKELADKRAELVDVKDALTEKLTLENTKAEVITELKAEREKLLSSASYSASAKKEINDYYAKAIENIAIATNVSAIEIQKNACLEGMNSVEILHVGLLVANLIFAVLLIGEILFLVFRKKLTPKKKGTKTYSSALPMMLLAAAGGSGFTVGVTFLVILILAVVALGIYIADKILRDLKGKTVFSPIVDKVDEIAKKCVDGAKKRFGKKAEEKATADVAVAEPPQTIQSTPTSEYPAERSNADETAVAIDEDEESEVFQGIEAHTGLAILVRYRKSFLAKLIQSSDETKRYYSDLKNALLSYQKVSSRISWSYDSVHFGRQKLAKLNVRGKTLYLYLALDPDAFAETKYKVERTDSKKYEATPCLYRIKNDRRAKYALDLIANLAEKFALTSSEKQSTDYAREHPYDTTESLVARGLIKELITKENYEAYLKRQQQRELDEKKREFVSASEVSVILSDEVAAALVEEKPLESHAKKQNKTEKRVRGIVNIDQISDIFQLGETVTLSALQEKGLLSKSVNHYKILARGTLNKPLTVEANEFSIEAVKMILLTGGKAIKIKE